MSAATKENKLFIVPLRIGLALYVVMAVMLLPILLNKDIRIAPYKAVNRLMPDYRLLMEIQDNEKEPDELLVWRSILYFRTVDRYFPKLPDVLGMLGYFYYADGKLTEAARSYDQANRVFPDFFWNRYNLALIYFQRGNYSSAIEELKAAIALPPEAMSGFMNFSRVYRPFSLAQPSFSVKAMQSLHRGYGRAYILLAQSCILSGNFAEAVQFSKQGAKINFENDEGLLYYYAGAGYYFLGDFVNAAAMLQQAVKSNPKNPEAFFYLAQAVGKLGQGEIAKGLLQKARVIGEGSGTILPDPKTWKVQMY